ncbi:MAG: hypothetical protein IJ759_07405 [Bacteroidales bacterium]|nr:hypothetical protein [Bacteroidales bacterium]
MVRINDAKAVISLMQKEFDSHDFIKQYIASYPAEYISGLARNRQVRVAVRELDRQIGMFLAKHDDDLYIERIGDSESENILTNITPCALWRRTQ